MTQLFLKSVLKEWVTKYHNAVHYETKQLHFRNTLKQIYWKEMDDTQRKSILESHILLKKNRYGKIKRITVVCGNKQRDYISKGDSSSPIIVTESVLLSCIIYAKE